MARSGRRTLTRDIRHPAHGSPAPPPSRNTRRRPPAQSHLAWIGQRRLIVRVVCERIAALVTLDVAADKGDRLGLDVVKIVVLIAWSPMLAPISSFVFGTGWPPFFSVDAKVGDVTVGAKNKTLFDLDAARVRQRKLDLLFLPVVSVIVSSGTEI